MATRLFLKQGDITEIEVDVIVNSANNDLILGSGVSGAIRRLGGPQIQEECNQIGTIPLGEAVLTTAGNLKCKWIIHAAVMPLGLWAEGRTIRAATRKTLKIATEKQFKKIAFPAIGNGAGAFPIDRCAELLIKECLELAKQPNPIEEIWFVLFDEKAHLGFAEKMRELCPEFLPEELRIAPVFVEVDGSTPEPPPAAAPGASPAPPPSPA